MNEKLILASESPRRKEIFDRLNVEYEVIPSFINEEEVASHEISPFNFVSILSREKAMNICSRIDYPAIIIAADTVISLNGKIMGKPHDNDDAKMILSKIQGKQHSVYSGVTIIRRDENGIVDLRQIIDNTSVSIRSLSEEEINDYVASGEPMDKAGAYAIQGLGTLIVEGIEGDYNTVVGLPLVKVFLELRNMGYDLIKQN